MRLLIYLLTAGVSVTVSVWLDLPVLISAPATFSFGLGLIHLAHGFRKANHEKAASDRK